MELVVCFITLLNFCFEQFSRSFIEHFFKGIKLLDKFYLLTFRHLLYLGFLNFYFISLF